MPDRPVPAPRGAADLAPPRTGMRLIGRGLRRHRRRLTVGYALLMMWHLSETLVPVVIGLVVDEAVDGGGWGDLAWTLGVLVALFAVLSSGYRFGSRFIVRSQELESHHLRVEISSHVLHPRGARTDRLAGETLSIATSDASLVPRVMHQLGFAVAAATSITVVAVYMLSVDVALGLLILVGVPSVLILIQLLAPLVATRTRRQQESTATTAGLAADLLDGLRPLKGIGGEHVGLRRYRGASRRAAADTIDVARSWGYLSGLTTLLSGILLAVVALVAGRRALDGDITLGELIALVGLTQFLAEPMRALGELSAQFAACRASATRIASFLQTPRLLGPGNHDTVDGTGELTLTGVHVGPLHGLGVQARRGELVALAIDDPAASDALVATLGGERLPDDGRVRLGDADLVDLTIEARRRTLLVATHHSDVFEGSLRTTVDPLGVHSDAELAPYLDASAADDVVRLHPDGLDRAVRAGGTTLSGGQRQRLALARALATDVPVLVLQDPTSAVDAVTEQAVAEGLRTVRGGNRTTVVITSSPALLQHADRVIVVRDGTVVAEGRHEDLLADPGYREMVLR